LDIDYDIAYC